MIKDYECTETHKISFIRSRWFPLFTCETEYISKIKPEINENNKKWNYIKHILFAFKNIKSSAFSSKSLNLWLVHTSLAMINKGTVIACRLKYLRAMCCNFE